MLKDEEVKNILNLYHKEAPTNIESAYTFALLGVLFIFGLRMSEVLGLKKTMFN
jgi:site-specific recombinase XerD